ncbi:hypothetical protein ABPG75_005870 [Micractinium tetrahymenae]
MGAEAVPPQPLLPEQVVGHPGYGAIAPEQPLQIVVGFNHETVVKSASLPAARRRVKGADELAQLIPNFATYLEATQKVAQALQQNQFCTAGMQLFMQRMLSLAATINHSDVVEWGMFLVMDRTLRLMQHAFRRRWDFEGGHISRDVTLQFRAQVEERHAALQAQATPWARPSNTGKLPRSSKPFRSREGGEPGGGAAGPQPAEGRDCKQFWFGGKCTFGRSANGRTRTPAAPAAAPLTAQHSALRGSASELPSVVGAGRKGRVLDAQQATSFTRCPGRWRDSPPDLLALIEAQRGRHPLSASVWADLLPTDYADREFLLYVLEHGLPVLPPEVELGPADCKNYGSCEEYRHLVDKQLRTDLEAGQLLRQPEGHSARYIHPLAAIPKSAEEVRIIHDLSYPRGRSINDAITYKQYTWASIDDALALVTPNGWMARVDVRNYYRHFPIDPADWGKLAFRWQFEGDAEPTTLWDPYLQFRQRNAPEVAHRFTLAILEMMRRRGYTSLVGIMDDFLIVCPTRKACEDAFQALLRLLRRLGFTVNMKPGKTVGPAQQQKFVGVLIDSVSMEVRLETDKLQQVRGRLAAFKHRASATTREVQSLAGLLNWACNVVYGGRTFLRSILDTISNSTAPSHHVRLGTGFHRDVRWWLSSLANFNGKAVILPALRTAPWEFQTDAEGSGAVGVFIFGGYVGLTYEQVRRLLPKHTPPQGLHITVYETYAALVAVRLFPDAVANRSLCLRSDNTATVAAVKARLAMSSSWMRWWGT